MGMELNVVKNGILSMSQSLLIYVDVQQVVDGEGSSLVEFMSQCVHYMIENYSQFQMMLDPF